MDEDETSPQAKITSSEPRVKDPKRVAAGKRLGAISKAAKEKKARERYNRERELEAAEGMDWTIPIVGVAIAGIVGLCYVCCKRGKPTQMEPTEPSPEPVRSVRERRAAPTPNTVLDSFDD